MSLPLAKSPAFHQELLAGFSRPAGYKLQNDVNVDSRLHFQRLEGNEAVKGP